MTKSTFVPNFLSIFIALLCAIESVWFAFVDTEKPDKISFFGFLSIVLCLLSFLLILWRWKKLKLLSRIASVLVCIMALLGPFACLVTYVDWFHQFGWLYSP